MTDAGHRTTCWSAAVLVLTALCLLTACSGGSPRGSGRSSAAPVASAPSGSGSSSAAGGPTWLVTRSALAELVANPSVRQRLASAQVYEILQPGQQLLAGVTAR